MGMAHRQGAGCSALPPGRGTLNLNLQLQLQAPLGGGALHQIHLTLPIPDGRQEKALLLGHLPKCCGAAKTGIGLARGSPAPGGRFRGSG